MASKQIFLANNAWQSLTAYVVGQQIVSGGFIQQVTTPGTSGGSAPGFSSTTGNTTADGSVVWICVGPTSAPVWLVPSDFSPINTIECIGGGGCGGDGSAGVAGGGGGGAYAKITHLILAQGASVPYQIGAGGVTGGAPSAGGSGGGTWFNGFELPGCIHRGAGWQRGLFHPREQRHNCSGRLRRSGVGLHRRHYDQWW